ncbi:MAG: cupin domain-containing protein [Deltaproteobacteria bacterium]|nr:cupin domain-containing protein [Deltaproteobacteria bacterium]
MTTNKRRNSFTVIIGLCFAVFIFTLLLCLPAYAQDSAGRKEIKRVEFSGTPNMEVITSISELKPGEVLPVHFHHGIEAGTVLQGGMVQPPGADPRALPTGAPIMNLRDVPHAGWKVVGDTTIKLFTVHVVDKGKPLYDVAK